MRLTLYGIFTREPVMYREGLSRRKFLASTAAVAASPVLRPASLLLPRPDRRTAQINIGLIASGECGRRHLKSLEADERTRVVAVWNVGERGIDEFLARRDVDAVVVATPERSQYEFAFAAVSAAKHVLCDIAAADSVSRLSSISRIARERARVLSIYTGDRTEQETLLWQHVNSSPIANGLRAAYLSPPCDDCDQSKMRWLARNLESVLASSRGNESAESIGLLPPDDRVGRGASLALQCGIPIVLGGPVGVTLAGDFGVVYANGETIQSEPQMLAIGGGNEQEIEALPSADGQSRWLDSIMSGEAETLSVRAAMCAHLIQITGALNSPRVWDVGRWEFETLASTDSI
jgi:hypothetical protein